MTTTVEDFLNYKSDFQPYGEGSSAQENQQAVIKQKGKFLIATSKSKKQKLDRSSEHQLQEAEQPSVVLEEQEEEGEETDGDDYLTLELNPDEFEFSNEDWNDFNENYEAVEEEVVDL